MSRLLGLVRRFLAGSDAAEPYARGHFYSPLPAIEEVKARASELFRRDVGEIPGIPLNAEAHRKLLAELVALEDGFDWPTARSPGRRFFLGNTEFIESAFVAYAMMRRFQPRRVIEVGGGYSSALLLDTDELFLERSTRFTFVDPHPERLLSLLRDDDKERCAVIARRVQEVPLDTFRQLEAGDLLFVDSTHVSKVGSDVNHVLFHVLPALAPGTLVHFHDIYWPFEYPLSWIVERKLAWNEAYVLRAFLQYNEVFEVLFFNDFAACRFSDLCERAMPDRGPSPLGSSIWLRKTEHRARPGA